MRLSEQYLTSLLAFTAMNRISIIVLAILIAIPVHSQEVAMSTTASDSLSKEVSILKQANSDLSAANDALKKRVATLENMMRSLHGESEVIARRVSAAEASLVNTGDALRDAKSGFERQILQINAIVSDQKENIEEKTIWGIIIALVVLTLSALLTFLLNRKDNAKIDALRRKTEKLNEEIVSRLSSEIIEIQNISSSIGALSAAGASSQNEQNLIIALADRITFMEMTLYRMNPSVRGYRQLTNSISQMKNNLLANSYELVDMLGKPYHEGMKVIANFVEDENIEQGKQIITGIIKPQINYHGQMIQAAQITVSQNI
jgi:cell division protein FtsB